MLSDEATWAASNVPRMEIRIMDQTPTVVAPARHGDFRITMLNAALIGAAVFIGVFVFWQVREALLLAFAAALFATLLLAMAEPVRRHTGLPQNWSVLVAGVVLIALIGAVAWLIGSQIVAQVSELAGHFPAGVDAIEQRFGVSLPAAMSGGGSQGGGSVASLASAVFSQFGSIFHVGMTLVGAVTSLLLVVFGGFFFATDPEKYQNGLVRLLPPDQQARARHALRTSGQALKLWLLGQLVSMSAVGLLAGLGTWALGLGSPLALGLFAGLTEFIPMVGSVLGAVPALLLAASMGGDTLLWTALLFVVIQQIESNLITPLAQKKLVDIPGGLLLFTVLAVGLLFGVIGIMIAAPLTVVGYVLVKLIYLESTLGEKTNVPGEHSSI